MDDVPQTDPIGGPSVDRSFRLLRTWEDQETGDRRQETVLGSLLLTPGSGTLFSFLEGFEFMKESQGLHRELR